MNYSEIIALCSLILAVAAIYVNMRVKLAQIDIKIASIQAEITEHKNDTKDDITKIMNEHKKDHYKINEKLDVMLEKIYELKK